MPSYQVQPDSAMRADLLYSVLESYSWGFTPEGRGGAGRRGGGEGLGGGKMINAFYRVTLP